MKFHQFDSRSTEQLFKLNHLSEFSQLWSIDAPWFEEPNHRRNGWSGVIKYAIKDQAGQPVQLFIKRQENHNCRTLLHPIKGIPTFRREYFNLKRLHEKKVPSLSHLYYGERILKGKMQSILITASLEGFQSFEELFSKKNSNSRAMSESATLKIMQAAGENTRKLHDAGFRHGSLYPKHFFAQINNEEVDVRLIDLEKLKWYPFRYLVRFNDLSRIIRRRKPVKKEAIQHFINTYLQYGKDLRQGHLAKKLYSLLEKY